MDHHAYLLLGERAAVDEYIEGLLAKEGLNPIGNPDIVVLEQNVFGVDDARALSMRAIERAFGSKKVFIMHADKFTSEAQNALLKTLEDPVPNTHFFISARDGQVFLPTLLSRLHSVRVGGEVEEGTEAKKFLKKTLRQRLDFAKKFADEVKDEERGAGALSTFLDSLLTELRSEGAELSTMKKILVLRTYAHDSAAMPRLVLEHLALVL